MPKNTSKDTSKSGSSTKQGIIDTPSNLGKIGKCKGK